MFRINTMTDYALMLLALLAQEPEGASASRLALHSRLGPPMVHKVLKALQRAGWVTGLRGTKGGYRLNRDLKQVSLAALVQLFDPKSALTRCGHPGDENCPVQAHCSTRHPWQKLNAAWWQALSDLSLWDFMHGNFNLSYQVSPREVAYEYSV